VSALQGDLLQKGNQRRAEILLVLGNGSHQEDDTEVNPKQYQ
jgi:hypothetical protein